MKEYGYFSKNGYVITDRDTPRHWYNYLFNNEYIASVSQVGFGNGFVQDNMGQKIPLVTDRAVYIVEENRFWQATALPIHATLQHYHCEHGIGYTDIAVTQHRIKSQCRYFVANDGRREFLRVTVKNDSRHTKSIKVIPYFATDIDGQYKPQCPQTEIALFNDEKNLVYGTGHFAFDEEEPHKRLAYLSSSEIVTGFDAAHNAFIGPYSNKHHPKALTQNFGCTNSKCIAEKICLVLENFATLEPGESKTFYYTVGLEETIEAIPQFLPAEIEEQYTSMRAKYLEQFQKLHIRTPWDDLDNLCNDWLKYQATLCSYWARIDSDQLADIAAAAESVGSFDPALGIKHIKRILHHQESTGFIPKAFFDDAGVADTAIQLTFAVYTLTKESGNFDLLQQRIPFANGENATVYEHVKRAIYHLWSHTGHNGLIRSILSKDEDILGNKGVSIRDSIAFVAAAKIISQMANWMGSEADSRSAAHYAQEMENRVNRFGWNSDRYIDSISDSKRLIGAQESEEGKLYALPQLWSVLAGLDNERSESAIDTLEHQLNTDLGLLYCAPPYSNSSLYPGLGENGGIDLNVATIKLASDACLKRNDKIEENLRKILPTHNEFAETHGEPYVLFDYYHGQNTDYRAGTPSPTWRTTVGPKLLHALIRHVFGLRPEFGGLLIRPCLPPSWKDCSISKEFRGCRYNIHFTQKDKGVCNTIDSIYINGIEANKHLPIKPQPDKTLNIEVLLRA